MIKLKRVYDKAEITDGLRILIDRLWPRGVRRSTTNIDLWLKEVGPSDELRKWYAHEPSRFKMFTIRYNKELRSNRAFSDLVNIARTNDTITLLFSASNRDQNNAVVLLAALKEALKKKPKDGE